MKMNKLLFTMLLAVFFLTTPNAMADPISDWNFVLEYGFSEWAPNTGVTGSVYNHSGNPTVLTWGSSYNEASQSSIGVTPGNSSGAYTLGQWTTAMNFYHKNNPILSTYTTLDSATLLSSFSLQPTGSPEVLADKEFEIEFWETPNDSYDTDIFWLKNPEDLISTFTIDNYNYTLEFIIDDLMDLPASARDHFGLAIGDTFKGLSTQEGQTSDFFSKFRLTAEERPVNPTPEPGTMVLFGFGLIGAAITLRKKITVNK